MERSYARGLTLAQTTARQSLGAGVREAPSITTVDELAEAGLDYGLDPDLSDSAAAAAAAELALDADTADDWAAPRLERPLRSESSARPRDITDPADAAEGDRLLAEAVHAGLGRLRLGTDDIEWRVSM